MTSRILEKIEDFFADKFNIYLDNQYSLISFGYVAIFLLQLVLYILDAITAVIGMRTVKSFANPGLPISIFLFSVAYTVFFFIVEPENKRWFGACGILSTVHLVCSVVYYMNVYVNLDPNDTSQLFYYTNWVAPISMFCMTMMLTISAYCMCKMSFLRSYKRMVSDLYETEEQGGKKAV